MTSNSIFNDNYKPQFSGHETFPIRYGWLEKAFHAVDSAGLNNSKIFSEDDAIAHFGVGKNMVSAIRFWAQVLGIITTQGKETLPTAVGKILLGNKGLDPYLENPSTLWRLHWEMASSPQHTAAYWLFNIFNEVYFDKEILVRRLMGFAKVRGWRLPSQKTIATDISVMLLNYSVSTTKKGLKEEVLISPFTELALVKARPNGKYSLNWGHKPHLKNGVFMFAVCDFWEKTNNANTINFQSLLLDPGSPGRVFLLEESELAHRLYLIEEMTGGIVSWSETAGLKQLLRKEEFSDEFLEQLLIRDYDKDYAK